MKQKEWAIYKGDDFKFMGTTRQCAEWLGISINSFYYLSSPAYKRRMKNYGDNTVIVDVTDAVES